MNQTTRGDSEKPPGRTRERFVGPTEAARLLGVSPTTIQRWIDAGLIRAHRTVGGHRRMAVRDLKAFAGTQGLPMGEDAVPMNRVVLVVDDDEDFRELLVERILSIRPDIEVHQAETGFQAGLVVSREQPALVFLDIRMPGLNGIDVCRMIKADSTTAGAAVVGMTVSRDSTQIDALMEEGAEEVLSKPFDQDVLTGVLDRFLPRASRDEALP